MPAIRWLGYCREYKGLKSLVWEFEKDLHMEVSAEWTVKHRPFRIPFKYDGLVSGANIQLGLLVKSSAINKRFKCDGGSGPPKLIRKYIPKEWRTKDLLPELVNIKPWEALCKKHYEALVIIKDKLNDIIIAQQLFKEELDYCVSHNIHVLIYQARKNCDSGAISEDWTLTSYESRRNESQ